MAQKFAFTLVQEDPPEPQDTNRPGVWDEQLQALVEHPGIWYRVRETKSEKAAKTIASSLRRKETRRPAGAWSFRGGISKTDGKPYVYARYEGEEEKPRVTRRASPGQGRPRGRTSFRQWLVQQDKRKDAVGELSRFAIKAQDWPRHGPMDRGRLEGYLATKGEPMTRWFPHAWKEYESAGA